MKSTSRFAYAEYRALTTCSAFAVAYASAFLCNNPQHFMYTSPDPHGQSCVAAPPNPDEEAVRWPIVLRFFFFFLDPVLAQRADDDDDDGENRPAGADGVADAVVRGHSKVCE